MISVVAANEKWAHGLVEALAPNAVVQQLESVRDAELCILHVDGIDLARGVPSCPVIAVMPGASLAAVVDLMDVSSNIVGAAFVDTVDRVVALARRVRAEPSELAELVPGAEIHSFEVSDFADKTRCLAQIAQLASGARIEPIEQCVDEMVMNALYDAPIDERGEHVFAGVSSRERVRMRTDRSVLVQYARADSRLVVLVRDAFGSLARSTVLRHLQKAARVEQKVGGAGLGLYLMTTVASELLFHVVPGIATTVICTIDFEQPQLVQLGFVEHDAAGRTKAAPARVIKRRVGRIAAGAAIAVAAAAAVAVVAWPRSDATAAQITFVTTPGAAIDIDGKRVGTAASGTLVARELVAGRGYRAVARLAGHETKRAVLQPRAGANDVAFELQRVATIEIDSQPRDALVEVDGKLLGTTPMELTTLTPNGMAAIAVSRPGYRTVVTQVRVPERGERQRIAPTLEPAPDLVAVQFTSTPPGAAIVSEGQQLAADRTYTPAEVFVQAGHLQRFTLVMPGYQPLVIEPFTAAPGARLEKGGPLAR